MTRTAFQTRFYKAAATLASAVTMAGCATAPDKTDACMEISWFGGSAALASFWEEVRGWDAARFETNCIANSSVPNLSPDQRLRLAMAYSAPNNPRRNLNQATEMLRGVDQPDQLASAARLQTGLYTEQERLEQALRSTRAQLTETSRKLVVEGERADTEARRALDESRRANAADERLRESERRFADVNLKLGEASRRLDALKAVENQMARKVRAAKARAADG